MILKNGTIIPFIFQDKKKLIAIPSIHNNEILYFDDVKKAIYSAFDNLKKKCEFYNPKIGFQIPEELFIPYLEQRHDLTNFIIKIIETDEEWDEDCKQQNPLESEKFIEGKNPKKRDNKDVCLTQVKKLRLDSIDDDLETILNISTEGQGICNNFESCKQLTEAERTALIEIVINFEFKNVLKSKAPIAFDTKRITTLSAAIVRRFPGEDSSHYFDEYLKSLKYIAGGKLYEHFLEKKLHYISTERSDKYFDEPGGIVKSYFPELEELQEINDVWHVYFRAWKYTFDLRIAYYRNSLDPMGYFEKLISNVQDRTNDLVEYDFERLHPKKSKNLFENWDHLSERIFTEALLMDRKSVPLILDLYGHITELSVLMMLSYFVKNYERDVKAFEKDDPENLVIHIESINGDPKKFFKDYNETNNLSSTKPLVFVTGNTELNFYVLVGTNLFNMKTVLKAVDFCFKCYQILQLPYPNEQSISWQVIQNAFYDIHTDNDCVLSETILKVLKN